MPRQGVAPKEVVARIHEAGGIASLAHPGLVEHDEWLPGLAADGLDALEAYHCNHDLSATGHYLSLAARLGLCVTGGSDYHADTSHGSGGPGSVSLPRDAYEKLVRLPPSRAKRAAASLAEAFGEGGRADTTDAGSPRPV